VKSTGSTNLKSLSASIEMVTPLTTTIRASSESAKLHPDTLNSTFAGRDARFANGPMDVRIEKDRAMPFIIDFNRKALRIVQFNCLV
jgi:hypothetical protein